MDWLLPIARYLAFPLLRWRNRRRDLKYLSEAERLQTMPAAELAARQTGQLQRLLTHAAQACPFYAERFATAGFDPTALRSPADLHGLPLLTKADIQTHGAKLLAQDVAPADRIANHTGGSTGAPLHFHLNRDSLYWRIAKTIRHDRWAGLQPYDRAALLWGHQRDLNPARTRVDRVRDALYQRRVVLDTSRISEASLAAFVERLRATRPTTYVAYAGAVFLLARYLRDRGIRDHHRPRSIITSAELLTADQRALIEEVFACPVFDRYGSREFSLIASECEAHAGLHIAADTLLVEVLRGGEPCRAGETGEVVITDLTNFAQPFIRYRIGDMGRLIDGPCSCGRTLPRMEISGGRVTDFLVRPDGEIVSGAAMTIYFIARVPGVRQAQVVQEARDHLRLRLATDAAFDADSRRQLTEAVARFFGPKMHFSIEPVAEIPPEPSGKYRFSISKLDPLDGLN